MWNAVPATRLQVDGDNAHSFMNEQCAQQHGVLYDQPAYELHKLCMCVTVTVRVHENLTRDLRPECVAIAMAIHLVAGVLQQLTGCAVSSARSSSSSHVSPRFPMKRVLHGGLSLVLDTGT